MVPVQMRLEAEALATEIRHGRASSNDAVSWATRWVDKLSPEALPEQLLEIVSPASDHPLDVARLLQNLAEQGDPSSLHQLRHNRLHIRIADVARGVLDGTIRPAQAARELTQLRWEVSRDGVDPDFDIFVALDSSTDHLPVGAERDILWSKKVLPQLDAELRDIETSYRGHVL